VFVLLVEALSLRRADWGARMRPPCYAGRLYFSNELLREWNTDFGIGFRRHRPKMNKAANLKLAALF